MSDTRFVHNEVVVLGAFATSIAGLYEALNILDDNPRAALCWEQRAAECARTAVRAARMLTVKEEYR